MRIRHKPWAKPELEACPFYISEPKIYTGNWNAAFPGEKKPIRLELGCGKGGFIAQEAPANLDYHYIARTSKMKCCFAKQKLEAAMQKNSASWTMFGFLSALMQFSEYFAPTDQIDRIYINFATRGQGANTRNAV